MLIPYAGVFTCAFLLQKRESSDVLYIDGVESTHAWLYRLGSLKKKVHILILVFFIMTECFRYIVWYYGYFNRQLAGNFWQLLLCLSDNNNNNNNALYAWREQSRCIDWAALDSAHGLDSWYQRLYHYHSNPRVYMLSVRLGRPEIRHGLRAR